MFKLDRKLVISASVAATVAVVSVGCMPDKVIPNNNSSASTTTIPSIDGGVRYPVINGKTGPYMVSSQNSGMKINNGRLPTQNELKAWDTDVMPDGTGLPEGHGTAEEGEELYDAKCVMCHGDFGSGGGGYPSLSKGNAVELQKTLTNNRYQDPEADGPTRVFGSYWPRATTLWWYIKDGMPHTKSKTLTVNETYALSAYVLSINEMEIDGVEVDDEYVLDREKFLKIKMPNENGFEPNIDGPHGPDNVRKYFENPTNFGAVKVKASERCMTNCQEKTAKTVYIKNGGISDFHPAMAVAKDLPVKAASDMGFNTMASYENNCMPCHGAEGMGAPVMGDKEAWTNIVTHQGMPTVYKNGLNGINGMPAKGGASVSDDEFKLLVDYMIDHSK